MELLLFIIDTAARDWPAARLLPILATTRAFDAPARVDPLALVEDDRVREDPAAEREVAERAAADLALDVPVADLAPDVPVADLARVPEPAADRAAALLAPELPAADRALAV
jgi:hypothetical protein